MDTFMWVCATPVFGFLALCFFAGFMGKVFSFSVKIHGFSMIFMSIIVGWVFFKFIGAY